MQTSSQPLDLNENITDVTRLLMASRGGMTKSDLARSLGVDKAIVTRSFAGTRPWKMEEVARLAQMFDVSPAMFFEPADSLFRSRCFSEDPALPLGELVAA